MMLAIVAFSVDAMLPAIPMIVADLELSDSNYASLVLTTFLLGLGIGTLFAGPLSDAFGRRSVVFWGLAVFALGALLGWVADSIEWMLAARFVQGIGAAGPRIVSSAVVRDKYSGDDMASIMSFSFIIFLTVPALAPMLGALIIEVSHWRGIFAAFVTFGVILLVWFGARQPETLPADKRRPLRAKALLSAIAEIFAHPTARLSIILQVMMMTIIFCVLAMVQPIFDVTYGRAESFPYWFGAIAVVSASSSIFNANTVKIFGMRKLVRLALNLQVAISSVVLLLLLLDTSWSFGIYIFWQLGVMMQVGLTTANLNSMAMEPMGHIAGTAASVAGATSVFAGAFFASLLAQLFDGTAIPLVSISLLLSVISSLLMLSLLRAERAMA